ncbi:MAG: molybdopterin-guanine dinucleotide biosynthesis protein B [Burkholderiales bacterium]|nr:molybdopterin-guanine dinucleotide biosynthesis protein B [Burkholderiales bacterium]
MQVFGFAGWSGSGKTTLIEKVVPLLVAHGKKVSLIKHAHHGFDLDQPGKDSYRHREAGCSEVLILAQERWALMHESRGAPELTLDEALARMTPCDLVLIEGYKAYSVPKLEVHRVAVGKPLLCPGDSNIVGIATDMAASALPADLPKALPRFDIDDAASIAEFVLSRAVNISRGEHER